MAVGPDVRISLPLPGAAFNANQQINVGGWGIPTPGASVTITGWVEKPGGGTTPAVAGQLALGTPNINWTLAIAAPQGGNGGSFTLFVRLVWTDPSLPGGNATALDQVVIVLN